MKVSFLKLQEELLRMPEEDHQYVSFEFSTWKKSQVFRPRSEHRWKMGDLKRTILGEDTDDGYLYDLDSARRTVVRFNKTVKQLHEQISKEARLKQEAILAWQQRMELLFGPARGSKTKNNVHQVRNKSVMDRYAASSTVPSLPGTLDIELSFNDPFDFIRIRDLLNDEFAKMDAEAAAKRARTGGAQ